MLRSQKKRHLGIAPYIWIHIVFQNNISAYALTRLGVSLGTGLIGLLATLNSALAAPAPVFEPVLDDLVASLPEGWGIRLPAAVNATTELYPYIEPGMTNYGSVFLGLSTESGCTEGDCVGALIFVSLQMSDWPPSYEGITAVDLGNGIQGYTSPTPEGEQILWRQDDLVYMLVYKFDVISEAEGRTMAQSMVNASPITAD